MSTDEERPAKRPRGVSNEHTGGSRMLTIDISIHFEDSIPIKVGKANKKGPMKMFHAPRNLIRARSTFFHTVIAAASSKDGKDETVTINYSPDVFSRYLHLLCTDEVVAKHVFPLYLMAEDLGDTVSANLIMDDMFQGLKKSPRASERLTRKTITDLYENTIKGSQLRNITSAYVALTFSKSSFKARFEGWVGDGAAEFFYDVAVHWVNASAFTTEDSQRDTFSNMPKETWHLKPPAPENTIIELD